MAFERLNEHSQTFLERGYLLPGQTAPERVRLIAEAAEKTLNKEGYADKLYDYVSRGWIAFSTPVWTNYGTERGLPISCFGSYIADDMGSIMYTLSEVGMMSKLGGGASAYFGDLRPRGAAIKNNGTSSGSVHFMQLFETLISVVSQGSTRRGHLAPYLPLEHPDADEFLNIGTEGNPIQKLTHGVTVGDEWLQSMVDGDTDKRKLRAKVIQRRGEMGYPYIMFSDNANNQAPDVYKDNNLTIHASNMCSEIMLPSREDRSFVCCLSSMNLAKYDEWKDTDVVETMIYFLDAVMQEFIDKLEELRDSEDADKQQIFEFMKRTYNFAKANRALGLGALGRHSYLQSKMISFESSEAIQLNNDIFKDIRTRADAASAQMATEYGEPELLKGYGRRNTTLMAVAPNTSSGFILGQVSQGIEPRWSNYYVKDVAKAKVSIKNTQLQKILADRDQDTREVWQSIRDHDGSVQHLDCLTAEEKEVFKTFAEINQFVVIDQAADRQKYIDQGQSLNVMVHPDTPVKDINNLYLDAWKQGIKALYYQHSMSAAQQLSRKLIKCVGCES